MELSVAKRLGLACPPNYALAWSPDGKRLAWVERSGAMVVVFDVETQREVWTNTRSSVVGSQNDPSSGNVIVWAPDGRLLASGESGVDWGVGVWNAETGDLLCSYEEHPYDVNGLAFSPDSKLILSASAAGGAKIWASETGQTQMEYKEDVCGLTCADWSPKGGLVATGNYDGAIHVWQPDSGQTNSVYTGHTQGEGAWITSVAFSHDGLRLASVQAEARDPAWREDAFVRWDLTAHVWEAGSGKTLLSYRLGEGVYDGYGEDYTPHCKAQWFPDDRRVFVYGPGASIHVIDVQQQSVSTLALPDDQADYAASLAPSGLAFATTSRYRDREGLNVWSFLLKESFGAWFSYTRTRAGGGSDHERWREEGANVASAQRSCRPHWRYGPVPHDSPAVDTRNSHL